MFVIYSAILNFESPEEVAGPDSDSTAEGKLEKMRTGELETEKREEAKSAKVTSISYL